MKCLFCKAELTSEYANYIEDSSERIIIIRNVPTLVCSQCGEKYYDNDVAQKLEDIVKRFEEFIGEIAILKYDAIV